ncbi:MAG: hypothetical protein PUK25_07400 [Clostridiales bacterium]|nr:hypothetical protein [Clostridiales bacterium]MDD7688648.1 hypothetical protein [Clostridiales bacterium]MDY5703170.1 hypothetical protein [Eubacteriales bacterium]
MSVFDDSLAFQTMRHVPEYYPEMYQDGFSPNEIMHAAHNKLYEDYLSNKDDGGDDGAPELHLTIEVK